MEIAQIASLLLFWFVVATEATGGAIVTNLVSYFDAVRTLPSGDCCIGLPFNGSCVDSCHNVINVCLVDSEGHSSEVKCLSDYTTDEFETAWPIDDQSPWIPQKHVFAYAERSLSFSGPITDGLTLMINASNVDRSRTTTRIATFTYPFPKDTSLIDHGLWSSIKLSFPQHSSVTFPTQWIDLKWKLVCNENYYGQCDVLCNPEDDDTNGHYTCDATTGHKACCDGYEDPGSNCVKPKDYCLSDPCKNGAKCNKTVTCACPHDSPCDSMACKYFQCKTRPSFQCLCTSKYEGQYCETKKPPLTGSQIAGVVVGALLGAAVLITFIVCVLWQSRCFPNSCY